MMSLILRLCALIALVSADNGKWVPQKLKSRIENVNPFSGLLTYSCMESGSCNRGSDMPTVESGAMTMEYVEAGFNQIATAEGMFLQDLQPFQ